MPGSEPENRWWKLLLILPPVVLGVVFAYFYGVPEKGTSLPPPIHTVELDSGHRLDVYEAATATDLTLAYPVHRSILGYSSSGSQSSYIQSFRFEIRRQHNQLSKATFETEHPSLILVVRLKDPLGNLVVPKAFVTSWPYRDAERILRDPHGGFEKTEDMTVLPTMPYALEMENGAGAWLPMYPAFVPHAADGRAFTGIQAFPRMVPKLKMRLLIPGAEPAEFEVANPAYPPAPHGWTADVAPWQRNLGEVEVSLDAFRQSKVPHGIPIPHPRYGIRSLQGQDSSKAYAITQRVTQDDTGNYYGNRDMALIPGTQLLRFSGTVTRTPNYVWKRTQATMIFKGTVAGGTPPEIQLTPSSVALGYGINPSTTTMSSPKPPTTGSTHQVWRLTIQGEAPRSAIHPQLLRLNHLLLFQNNSDHMLGVLHGTRAGTSGEPSNLTYWSHFQWTGGLKTGDQIEIGIPHSAAPMHFDFVIPIGAIPPP